MKIYMSEKDVHLDAINTATIELTAENGFDKIMVWVYNGVPVESLEQLKQEVRREFAGKVKDGIDRKCKDKGATDLHKIILQSEMIDKIDNIIDNLLKQYEEEV
jgi:hypothetical protein